MLFGLFLGGNFVSKHGQTGAKKKSQANEHDGQNTALAVFFLIFLFSLPAVSFSDLIRKT